MESPFVNDPFARVWLAFKRLYPGKECMLLYSIKPKSASDDDFGYTQFIDGDIPQIVVYFDLPAECQIEFMMMELARVAVGPMKRYGKRLDEAYMAIFTEYDRIGLEEMAGVEKERRYDNRNNDSTQGIGRTENAG